MHTYLPTYIRTYVHTYIRTYVHTYIRTYAHTYKRTYVHTYIHTYIYIYIHIYIYIYIHTWIHDNIHINHYKSFSIYIYIYICIILIYCTVYTCSCSKQQGPNTAHLPESKSQRQGNADHRFAARQCGEVPFRFASFGSGQLPRGGEHVKFHQTSWGGKRYHLKVVCVILFVSLRKDVTMFSLVSTNCFTENWWRLLRIILYPFFACFKDLEAGPDRSRHTPRSGWSWPQVLAQVDQNKEILPLSSDGATVLMEPGRRSAGFDSIWFYIRRPFEDVKQWEQ